MSCRKLLFLFLVGVQMALVLTSFGLILAAAMHAGPLAIFLAVLGYTSMCVASVFDKKRFPNLDVEGPFVALGCIGAHLPIVVILMAPGPWRILGGIGYLLQGLEPVIYAAAMTQYRLLREEADSATEADATGNPAQEPSSVAPEVAASRTEADATDVPAGDLSDAAPEVAGEPCEPTWITGEADAGEAPVEAHGEAPEVTSPVDVTGQEGPGPAPTDPGEPEDPSLPVW